VQNGLLELGAGIVTILIPSLFFSNSRSIPHATYIARWWAAAVIAIGSMSLLMSTLPASNMGRQYAGVGFLIYHILLTILHTRVADSNYVRPGAHLYAGFAIHTAMSVLFLLHLHALGTHNAVIAALM
jgi:hypothetical protein